MSTLRKQLQAKFETAQAKGLEDLPYSHQEVRALMAERDSLASTLTHCIQALQASEKTIHAIEAHTQIAKRGLVQVKETVAESLGFLKPESKPESEEEAPGYLKPEMIQAIMEALTRHKTGEDCEACDSRDTCGAYKLVEESARADLH